MLKKLPDKDNLLCFFDFGKSSLTLVADLSGNGNHGTLSEFQGTGAEFVIDKQYGQVLDFSNSVNTKVEIPAINENYKTFMFLLDIDEFYSGESIKGIYSTQNPGNSISFGKYSAPRDKFVSFYSNPGVLSKEFFAHDRGKGITPVIFRQNTNLKYDLFIDSKKIAGTVAVPMWNNEISSLGKYEDSVGFSYLGKMVAFGLWKSELTDNQCLDLLKDLSAWSPKHEILRTDKVNWFLNSHFESGLIDYDFNGGNDKCFVNENGNLEFTDTCWLWQNYGKTFKHGTAKQKVRKKLASNDQFVWYFQTDVKTNNTGAINGYAIVLDDQNDKIELWKNGTAIISENLTIGTDWHEIEIIKSGNNFALSVNGQSVGNVDDSDYAGKGHECFYCVAGNWEVESYEIKYT